MINLNDLKSIFILTHLEDHMLAKIAKITNIHKFANGDYIFKEGDRADCIYSVINGKIGLEIEKNSSAQILIDHINQGMTFGFSSLVDTEDKSYTTSARALSDTKLFKWKSADLEELFSQDYEMGYLFIKRITKIIKTRLQIRNVQFLNIYK